VKVASNPLPPTVASVTNLTNMNRCVELYPPCIKGPDPDSDAISGSLLVLPSKMYNKSQHVSVEKSAKMIFIT